MPWHQLPSEAPIRKVFHHESPRERYKCDAVVLCCFDSRFETTFRKFIKRIGMTYVDPIRVAGGAKCLAGNDKESERNFVLEQIRTSVRLHQTDTVVLILHSDCGAYGGLAAFQGDTQKEAENHRLDLHRAMDFLRAEAPDLSVRAYFMDFEGVWEAYDGVAQERTA